MVYVIWSILIPGELQPLLGGWQSNWKPRGMCCFISVPMLTHSAPKLGPKPQLHLWCWNAPECLSLFIHVVVRAYQILLVILVHHRDCNTPLENSVFPSSSLLAWWSNFCYWPHCPVPLQGPCSVSLKHHQSGRPPRSRKYREWSFLSAMCEKLSDTVYR